MSDYPGAAIRPDAPCTILIAGSASTDARVIAGHLAREGFRVQAAHDRRAVMACARRSQPDLIVLDLDIPEVGGLVTCRGLKQHERTRDIPVIVITSARDGHEFFEGISAGAADQVPKPVRIAELMVRVWVHIALHLTRRRCILQQRQLFDETRRRRLVQAELSRLHVECEQRIARSAAELAQVKAQLIAQIDGRRVSDGRLLAGDARFRTIVDSGPVAMCVTSMPDGRLLYVNAQLRELLGDVDEHKGGTVNLVDFFVDPAEHEQLVRCLTTEGRICEAEVRLRGAGGPQIWAMATARVASYEDRPAIYVGLHDISGRKDREMNLLRSREQQREVSAYLDGLCEYERKRSALEIQDDLGQLLTALKMDVSLLRMRLADDPETIAAADDMHELVEGAIWMVRNVAGRLRPAALDFGLISALEWLTGQVGRRDGIRCDLHVEGGEPRLPDMLVTALFRIVEAALTNVVRHAAARRIDVTLSMSTDALDLGVRDDGCGLDLATAYAGHAFGLRGMAERARMIGGTLGIDSQPGKGTTVSIHVPRGGRSS